MTAMNQASGSEVVHDQVDNGIHVEVVHDKVDNGIHVKIMAFV